MTSGTVTMAATHQATTVTTLASETFSATYVYSALYYTATHTALVISAH